MPVPAEYQRATEEFYAFLTDVRDSAGLWSTHAAYTMTQGVFQTFRRRVTVEEAIGFANIMPAALRALFVADWDVRAPILPFGSTEEMTREVQALRPNHNFATNDAIAVVAGALRRAVGAAEFDRKLTATVPTEAALFWRTT